MADIWSNAIKHSPDPQRAKHFFQLLSEKAGDAPLAKMSEEESRILATILGGSEALGNTLIAHPEWLGILTAANPSGPESLKFPRRKEGFAAELDVLISPFLENRDYEFALHVTREYRQREMLRIAARDLGRLANVLEITRELSALADTCLQVVWKVCLERLSLKHGTPFHPDPEGNWHKTKACVLGMGKLGGEELNYSSDVDVLFVYSDEGIVCAEPPSKRRPPAGSLTNHQFFCRIAEAFIAEVSKMTAEGMLYRIDLRLRPEGDAGPLARSLASYENYYAQWGQTWERMMMIKARGVAGAQSLAAEFLEMIQPFRYPRSIQQDVLHEVAALKDRIENEVVKADELERNVKLGKGGIREIEFIAQSQQVLHAGKQPFLQGSQTVPTLDALARYDLLSRADADALRDAYCFLRDVEHRLQMEDNLQTHTIPTDKKAQDRLARLMGYAPLSQFEAAHRAHRAKVRKIFDKVLHREARQAGAQRPFPHSFDGTEAEWKRVLAEHKFRDLDKAFRVLREFVEGPGYVHVSNRTRELALKLLPRLLVPLSDPDRVVTRLDSFIGTYGARSTLFELWNSNPTILNLLVALFDRSEFLAELAIRVPDLVDELVMSGRLRQRKKSDETLEDLRHGINDADQHAWVRRYHQAELMRIGLRDILGLADEEQYLVELSALADACLRYAIEVVIKKHAKKPTARDSGSYDNSTAPFAVIGMGKLGGAEIDYGSDLDILFVSESGSGKGKAPDTTLQKMAAEVMDLLSKRTEDGIVFHTDARLRPDGEKGLLVNSLKAYEEYYRQRAALWEIQSLTRARFVAGNIKVGEAFQQMAATLTNFKKPSSPLAPYSPKWKEEIRRMRERIEKERTPTGKDALAIKTGKGGLVDAEFGAQILCLENGWHEPNTMKALQLAESSSNRGEAKASERTRSRATQRSKSPASPLIENYRKLRRVEGILRRWSYEGESVLPDDPAAYYRVAVRCGFKTADEFKSALAEWRKEIRSGYEKILES